MAWETQVGLIGKEKEVVAKMLIFLEGLNTLFLDLVVIECVFFGLRHWLEVNSFGSWFEEMGGRGGGRGVLLVARDGRFDFGMIWEVGSWVLVQELWTKLVLPNV